MGVERKERVDHELKTLEHGCLNFASSGFENDNDNVNNKENNNDNNLYSTCTAYDNVCTKTDFLKSIGCFRCCSPCSFVVASSFLGNRRANLDQNWYVGR